jgi:hypothetical protein
VVVVVVSSITPKKVRLLRLRMDMFFIFVIGRIRRERIRRHGVCTP